jgi:hypothetical protein
MNPQENMADEAALSTSEVDSNVEQEQFVEVEVEATEGLMTLHTAFKGLQEVFRALFQSPQKGMHLMP